jgi:hypothetical protein
VQQFDGPSQGVPSWPQPPGASWQRPGLPAVAEQRPEQHSDVVTQRSPGAWHAADGTHEPPWQLREQQSSEPAQESPRVLQAKPPAVWSWAQTPFESVPVQHSLALAAGEPVWMQCVPEQTPPRHVTEQQSPSLAQASPGSLQNSCDVHLPFASHVLEQQSLPEPHASPLSLQAGGGGFAHFTFASQTRPVRQQAPLAQDAPTAPHVGWVTHLPWSQESPSTSQQAAGPSHAAFTPAQVVGVTHLLFEQMPVQQPSVDWHAPPSEAQAGAAPQVPPLQYAEQQSAGAEQDAPFAAQLGVGSELGVLHARTRDAAATNSPRRKDALRMLASLQTLRPTMAQHAWFFY